MEFLKSFLFLLLGIVKRLYWLAPALFTDPFDFLKKWFKVSYEPPPFLFWILLSLGLGIATALTYHELRMQKVHLEKHRKTRQDLGGFLSEGMQIKNKCYDKDTEAPVEEADQWSEKIFRYLDATLGNDYAQRFKSHEGLPVGITTLSGKQARVGAYISSRLARLNQFLAELTQPN